jgi:hypothetical protein
MSRLLAFPRTTKTAARLATILKSEGIFVDNGSAAAQEAATRLHMTGADDPMQGTSIKQLLTAAQSYGLDAQKISGLRELNNALAHGKTVIEGGAPTLSAYLDSTPRREITLPIIPQGIKKE